MPVLYHDGRFPPSKLDWSRLSPLTAQEAVLSSRIEGTQATLGEVLEFEATVLCDIRASVRTRQ